MASCRMGRRGQLEHLTARILAVRERGAIQRTRRIHRHGLPRPVAGKTLAAGDIPQHGVVAAIRLQREHVAIAIGETCRRAIERAIRSLDKPVARAPRRLSRRQRRAEA